MIWADIHCHTNASDGTLSPYALIQMAKESGLQGISITDHDTIFAYPEAQSAAQTFGIHLGSGIEFSSVFEGIDVHLLGYDFHLHSPEIHALCLRHQKRRADRNLQMLEKLREEGIDILPEELGSSTVIGRPHIAQVMVQKGIVSSVKEAFYRYLAEGKQCYVQGERVSVEETIQVIHAAGGKAFLAHPHFLPNTISLSRLLDQPFDGIECWYANLSPKSATPWVEMAKKRKWIISGGSDYHGQVKPELFLGRQGVDQSTFYQIFTRPLV